MAESSLSVGKPELTQAIGHFLGYGSVIADWAAAQVTEIDRILQSGVRRVYYPIGAHAGYEWSFLRPTSIFYLGAIGTDGTIASSTTFDSATYTDWVAQGITTDDTLTISDSTDDDATVGDYAITTVAVGDITLTTSPAATATGVTFLLKRSPADYDLPDDFGRLIGDMHYSADEARPAIVQIDVGKILQMRARYDQAGAPYFCAVRPKSSTGASGQRQEIIFYPKSDSAYTLSYNYEAYSGELTDSLPYPLGGMQMSELYIESCLSVAEQRVNDEIGLHTQVYQAFLSDAIARDGKKGAHFYGDMGGAERDFGRSMVARRRGRELFGDSYSISYNGNQI